MTKLKFNIPAKIFTRLTDKYHPINVADLIKKLQGAHCKIDRELFYGAIFCEGLNQITSKVRYFIRISEVEPGDFEIVDRTQYYRNQKVDKKLRVPDHFKFQNVMITSYDIKRQIESGNNNIYEIIAQHLYVKKLSRTAGDYRNYILLFHFRASINKIDLRKLRDRVRKVKQINFDQIWITSFSSPQYNKVMTAELMHQESELQEYPIQII